MACAKAAKSPEEMFSERCDYELDVIKNGGPIDGVEFVKIGEAELNDEKRYVFEWIINSRNLKMDMILPGDFPDAPPWVRISDLSDRNDLIDFPDVDPGGFVRIGYGINWTWMAEKTLRELCLEVIKLFSDSRLLAYANLRGVHGHHRHRMPITRDEYDVLVNPFGRAILQNVELNHSVRLEIMGGKTRARQNKYEIVIKGDDRGVWSAVMEEIRNYSTKQVEKRRREHVAWVNRHRFEDGQDKQQTATEENCDLDSMAGVAATSSTTKLGPSVSRGRGRGRGRLSRHEFPMINLPGQVGAAPQGTQASGGMVPGHVWVQEDRPVPEFGLELVKQSARTTCDHLRQEFDHTFDRMIHRLDRMDAKVRQYETVVRGQTVARQAAQEQYRTRRNELLAQLNCRCCKIREKKIFLNCFHIFCEPCSAQMQQYGWCFQCGLQITEAKVAFF